MLYIHIPFCKQACHYCDFHFSTNLDLVDKIVDSICLEINIRKEYLTKNTLDSIYFGGGTPSLLSEKHLKKIFNTISGNFQFSSDIEITLEANPDDLNSENLEIIRNIGINRLSIGIQSFHENHLKFMNRAHNSIEAVECIENAKKIGFDNLSIDLIYGIPAESHEILMDDLEKVTSFGINHVSAYCLTIEPKTAFGKWVKNKTMNAIDEDFASEQFEILMNTLQNKDFEQYEISNFAKNNSYSKHNTSYWTGKHYLGIGPSAHSFNGESRQSNIYNNSLYIKGIENKDLNYSLEILSTANKTNEYLMTSLRTIWGVDLNKIEDLSSGKFQIQNYKTIENYLSKNWIQINDDKIQLTQKGKYFADQIASNLFIEL